LERIKVNVYLLLNQQINPVEQSQVKELYPALGNKNKALLEREEFLTIDDFTPII